MMGRQQGLLVSTFGANVSEIVPGLRALPHDHLILVVETTADESAATAFLARLGVRYEALTVDLHDLAAAAMRIVQRVQDQRWKGWNVRFDITGGRKLLSDTVMLAALAIGAEVCCYETKACRFPLLAARGVEEALPREVADALLRTKWPFPLATVQELDGHNPLAILMRRMREMDLIEPETAGKAPALALTGRGRACLDWLQRMEAINRSSE
jgi:hypothetical protein